MTGFRVLQSFGGLSLLAVKPYSGRLHQIRVHMSFLGTPVVGDKIYGHDEREFIRFIETGMTPEMEARLLLPRHALHASEVTFLHHNLRREVTITAPFPSDMREFVRRRGGDSGGRRIGGGIDLPISGHFGAGPPDTLLRYAEFEYGVRGIP